MCPNLRGIVQKLQMGRKSEVLEIIEILVLRILELGILVLILILTSA